MDTHETKICLKCNITLLISHFEYSDKSRGYIRNVCRTCRLKDKNMRLKIKKESEKIAIHEKICSTCNTLFTVDWFSKRSTSVDGYNPMCKGCYRIKRRNKPKTKEISNITQKQCSTCHNIKDISSFRKNAISNDGYFNKCNDCWKPREWNKEKQKQSEKKYIQNNPDKLREKYKRQGNKIHRRIRSSLNHRIADLLKKGLSPKNRKTLIYVGCKFDHIKKWFEFLFEERMNWDNYGKWEIDHVIPCTAFDLNNEEEQIRCFNWTNLRPCWKIDNIKKGDKIIDSIIQAHNDKVQEFTNLNPLPT